MRLLCMIIIGMFRNNLKVWNPDRFLGFLSYGDMERVY